MRSGSLLWVAVGAVAVVVYYFKKHTTAAALAPAGGGPVPFAGYSRAFPIGASYGNGAPGFSGEFYYKDQASAIAGGGGGTGIPGYGYIV